ncbi:MAG: CHAT domain-containing protein [Proteobacteria bacterium]|nr:MAG: CHAT domain-containing protein [Pseudomonadota bacterium]
MRFSLAILILMVSLLVRAQQVDSAYLAYQAEFGKLMTSLIGTSEEAVAALTKYRVNDITSNEEFAGMLGRLYSKKKGIGVLFYILQGDTLRRTFFRPGEVVEERKIPVRREELAQLGQQLSASLAAYKEPSPLEVQRGVKAPAGKGGFSLDSVLARLSALLLPEAFSREYRHLIVIPAFNIGVLPFQLLRPYRDSTYLIDQCSITIAPTLIDAVGLRMETVMGFGYDPLSKYAPASFDEGHALHQLPDSVDFPFENVLFVSDPAYPSDGPRAFPKLQGAQREVAAAAALSRSYKILSGAAAQKDSVLHYMNGRDVAYFATHGVSASLDAKRNTFLVLAPPDPYLTSLEIAGLRHKEHYRVPEFVILSACQTGLGEAMDAGVMGSLARSFILAGANHVLMSLWNVDDAATAYLVSRYVFHLQHRDLFVPSGPLRKAILETKARFPHPAKWAGFSLFGVDY